MPPRKCCHLPYLPRAPDGHRPPTTHAWKPTQKESLSEGRHWSLCESARSRVIQRHVAVLSAVLARLADRLSVWEGSASPCDLPAAVQVLPFVPDFCGWGRGGWGSGEGSQHLRPVPSVPQPLHPYPPLRRRLFMDLRTPDKPSWSAVSFISVVLSDSALGPVSPRAQTPALLQHHHALPASPRPPFIRKLSKVPSHRSPRNFPTWPHSTSTLCLKLPPQGLLPSPPPALGQALLPSGRISFQASSSPAIEPQTTPNSTVKVHFLLKAAFD